MKRPGPSKDAKKIKKLQGQISKMRLALAMFHQFCNGETVLNVGRAVLAWEGRRPEECGSKEWQHIVAAGVAASGVDTPRNISANMKACRLLSGGPRGEKRMGLPKMVEIKLTEEELNGDLPDWWAACFRVYTNLTDDELNTMTSGQVSGQVAVSGQEQES